MAVDTVEEAIELANQTTYSLSAAIWSTNVHTAMYVAERLRSGYTNVNGGTFHTEARQAIAGLGFVLLF
jgi:acyl-CoA reductase-like NAD-dependent aldehyde dehydrogenase